MSPRRRYCPHGHDTSVVGRNQAGCCRECHRAIDRRSKQRYKKTDVGRAVDRRYWSSSKGYLTAAIGNVRRRIARKTSLIVELESQYENA